MDSFLAEIGDDLDKVDHKVRITSGIIRGNIYNQINERQSDKGEEGCDREKSEEVEDENIDGEEIPLGMLKHK